jgi:hypothetical protein
VNLQISASQVAGIIGMRHQWHPAQNMIFNCCLLKWQLAWIEVLGLSTQDKSFYARLPKFLCMLERKGAVFQLKYLISVLFESSAGGLEESSVLLFWAITLENLFYFQLPLFAAPFFFQGEARHETNPYITSPRHPHTNLIFCQI